MRKPFASGTPAGPDTYSYTAGTNRLASIANAGGTRSFAYDDRGNLAAESRPGSVSATTAYDSYGRLTAYARSDIGTLAFAYNGRDDRVAQTSGIDTRRFVYAPDGRVLGEYGLSAADVKAEFIWTQPEVANDNSFGGGDGTGGYAPLAVATPDSGGTIVLNWVHGNHLGVPLVTTDASGNPATTPGDYLAPGFPGQSRTLADLYYNRYRDFDPTTGRYIQADPIGLAGGSNPYLYAGGNPVRYSDPTGKCPWCLAIGVGALIGALIDLDIQLVLEHRHPMCIDWERVAMSGAIGGLTGGIGEAAGPLLGRIGGRLFSRAAAEGTEAGTSFFEGTQYTSKVLQQMRGGVGEFHSFPESVTAFEGAGSASSITGGDGAAYQMLRIPGSYQSTGGTLYEGEFQFMKNSNGLINHRLFVPTPVGP